MPGIFDTDIDGVTRTGTAGATELQSASLASPAGNIAQITHGVLASQFGVVWDRPDIVGTRGWSNPWEPSYLLRDWPEYAFDYTRDQFIDELVILADASNDVDQLGSLGNSISHAAGVQAASILRSYFRFRADSIPPDRQISSAVLRLNSSAPFGNGADTYIGGPYNGDGQGNPVTDAGVIVYARCEVSGDNYFSADTLLRTVGVKSWTLGAQAIADLNAARTAGATYFSVALRQTDETAGSDRYAAVYGFSHANAPALILTFALTSSVTISDAEDEIVTDGETDFTISGNGFGDARGAGSVELNTAADGSGVAVAQTVTSWSNTSIVITVVRGSHSDGTLYLVVRTDAGLRSNGWPVTLATGAASGAAGWWAATGVVGIFDAKTVDDYLNDVNMAALTGSYRLGVGDVRLPIRVDFAQIRNVNVSFLSVGANWTWRLLDRDTDIGPRIQTYNAGVLADATIDARVSGLK